MGTTQRWFSMAVVKDFADVGLKLAAAIGILAGVSIYLFPASVVIRPAPDGRREGYFQAEIDRPLMRQLFAERKLALPLAIETMVTRYNALNERDLTGQLNRTSGTITPIGSICSRWPDVANLAFGEGFCAGDGPTTNPHEPRLRYQGRSYERWLIEVNEEGLPVKDGSSQMITPPRLAPAELAAVLEILHQAEFSVGRVEIKNEGRGVAEDVRIYPPSGYNIVGPDDAFSLQPNETAARRYETARGDIPVVTDRRFDINWKTGKGYIHRVGVVVSAIAVVIAITVVSLIADFLSHKRASRSAR